MNAIINNRDRQATKPKLSMRLFRVKQRGDSQRAKRDGQQRLQSIPSGELEARTDVANKKDVQTKDSGTRELSNGTQQQQLSTPKRRISLKSPPSPASGGGSARSGVPSPRSRKGPNESNHSQQNSNNRAITPTAKTETRLRSPPKQHRPSSAGPTVSGSGDGPKVKSPPSILHRHTNFGGSPTNARSPTALSPSPPHLSMSPMPMPAYHNPRVRFMSSGNESVASTEASAVHLMAGAAGSVASSSAMSSSADNRENVFDRVLNMVMAEEHERLNAMGMSRSPDPKSDAARAKKAHENKERFAKADAKARIAVAAAVGESTSGSDEDLGLKSPNPMDLAPIDIDTGLEIGGSYDAPIDMDTGLEVHHKSPIDMDTGLEVEYHDLNDDEVDEERWKRLNEKALTTGMKGLSMNKDRRCRSYDCSRQQPPVDTSHNRVSSHGSDPEKYRRSNSGATEANWSPLGGGKSSKKSPTNKKGNKKTKKFWDKSKDFQSDEWVAFDNQGHTSKSNNERDRSRPTSAGPSQLGRVDDLAAF